MKRCIALVLFSSVFVVSLDTGVDYEAHEWGVFEYYQGIGADIFAAKNDLPEFVVYVDSLMHSDCGKDCKCTGKNCPNDCQHTNWRTGQKEHCPDMCQGRRCTHMPVMRKPVINIYSKSDFNLKISASIRDGKLMAWYPKHSDAHFKGEKVTWNDLRVTTKNPVKSMRESKSSPWWEIARDTDACFISTNEKETEKFIFYEGESEKLTPQMEIREEKGKVILTNKSSLIYNGVFIVRDRKIKFMEKFNKSQEIDMTSGIIDQKEAIDKVEQMLKSEGMNDKEAKGVAKIWETDFFDVRGLRVIYMKPRDEVDRILKVEFTPKPKEFKRAILVVVNDTESMVKELIKKLGSDDSGERDRATETLIRLGKNIRKYIVEALEKEKDTEVRSRLQQILEAIDGKKGGKIDDKDKQFIKEGLCNGDCDRVHYAHPQEEAHTQGAKCARCAGKIDVCYLMCTNCCKALNVCYGCNKEVKEFKDERVCRCGSKTHKANAVKYETLLWKQGIKLNKDKDETRYVLRNKESWDKMQKEIGLDLQNPDFDKEIGIGIVVGKGGKVDLRTIVEEEKRVRVVYTIDFSSEKKLDHTIIVLKINKTDKPVEFCKGRG